MKDYLSEEEKIYIKNKILEPMRPSIEKAAVFGTIPRAQIMLETSLRGLRFDKGYEARVIFDKRDDNNYVIKVQARKLECEEYVSLDYPLKLRQN